MLLYNSRDVRYKFPFGAVATGQKVTFNFPVSREIDCYGAGMVIRGKTTQKILMRYTGIEGHYLRYTATVSLPEEGIYYYRFEIYTPGGGCLFVGNGGQGAALIGDWLPEWQLTVFKDTFNTPEWLKGGVIYHIFPDRFARVENDRKPRFGYLKPWSEDVTIVDADGVYRANDFFGGNVEGVIENLQYIKSLGVTAIYFSPIFESSSNHRYDTADYTEIDPLFGDEESFSTLIKEAEKYGIGIILDGVFNHTGADSIYFNKFGHYPSLGAYQSQQSPYYPWYTFQEYPDKYDCWWGVTVVPTVSRGAQGFQNFIAGEDGIIDKWTRLGVKGWRLDVVDELSTEFVRKIRTACKRNGTETAVIGEVWEDASTKVSYGEKRSYLFGEELDGVMNYPFRNAIIGLLLSGRAERFAEEVMTIAENYPRQALECSMSLLGTHDTVRIINELAGVKMQFADKRERKEYRLSEAEYERGKSLLKVASALQFYLPGVPTVYYGDEAGVQGFSDPLNRRTFPLDGGDKDLVEHYRKLGALRKKFGKEQDFAVIANGDVVTVRRGVHSAVVDLKQMSVDFD